MGAPLRRPIGFAHRGARAHAPENTLEAFALALEMGAEGLESDVWITADGVVVLDHDGVVAVAGASRPIGTLPRSALPGHVPSLAELYAYCGGDYELSLDVKDPAGAGETVAVAEAAGAAKRLWLCHWNWKTVASWRPLSSAIQLVDSTRARHMRTPPPERARRMRERGIDAINLHWSDWTADDVEHFHEQGRLAWAWDLQEPDVLARTLALGVDAAFSDHVPQLRAALGELARGSNRT